MTLMHAVVVRTEELRRERNISKRELARLSELPHGTMTSIYKELASSISLRTLRAICCGLGVTMSEFLDSEYFGEKCLNEKDPVS